VSNDLAIATVTATLAETLSEATQGIANAVVTTKRPQPPLATDPPTVNLFLYRVVVNAALAGDHLPTRGANGGVVRRPQAALNLHYLLSFTGDDAGLLPQRLLGRAVNALQTRPILSRTAIETAKNRFPGGALAASDLAGQAELVKLSPLPLDLEELSKLWSAFFEAPYALSTAYEGSLVLLEPEISPQPSMPVAERTVRVVPFRRPTIRSLGAATGGSDPLAAGATMVIRGTALRGERTKVRIGRAQLEIADADDEEILVELGEPPLPAGTLRAGAQGVQVVHEVMLGSPPEPRRGSESPALAVVVSPRITKPGSAYDLSLANVSEESGGTLAGELAVGLAPSVGPDQRALLTLVEASGGGHGYTFAAEPRTQASASVAFALQGIAPATYLVSVSVDGASSPLERDEGEGPTAGQYIAPTIEVS